MAGLSITPEVEDKLERYIQLLARWNETINLTALPLQPPTSEALDRLLIEPLLAAGYIPSSVQLWIDVGSGGGSPAIPIKIVHRRAKLTMTESRGRKAAFLMEAVRTLALEDAKVETDRFEAIAAAAGRHAAHLVTVRAVMTETAVLKAIGEVLAVDGQAFFFHSGEASPQASAAGLTLMKTVSLGSGGDSYLSIFKPVFHVEQSD
jgi:16S rRNA (guanine527-N7)-methyltransferase